MRKSAKIHYAHCDKANESDNCDYWYSTACGIELEPKQLTQNKKMVTCLKCIKAIKQL